MNFKKFLIIYSFSLMITSAEKFDSKYSIRSIKIDSTGFPEEIEILYYQPKEKQFEPSLIILDKKIISISSLKKLRLIQNREEYNIYEFSVTFDKFEHIFSADKVCQFVSPITWPFISLNDSATFVPLVKAKHWVVGFSTGVVKDDEYVKKWFEKAQAKQ